MRFVGGHVRWTSIVVTLAVAVVVSMDRPAVARQARPVTLEALLAAPFISEIVAAPQGARVAWVSYERGARNVWMAEAPAFDGRRLTGYDADDGQDVTNVTFAGDAVVYVRGGGTNRAGDYPNPTSDTAGVEQAVWIVPTSGGTPRRLGAGSSPAVSPKGDLVAFTMRGQIWLAGVTATPAAAQAAKLRGSASGLVWSPDGSRIAFSSGRGSHAFIGVLDVPSKAVTWLGASLDTDLAPAWSADGRRVAFIRTSPERDVLPFFPRRQGHPWSIHIADVKTGVSREVWRAADGRGSVFQGGDVRRPLVWTADDRLVFPWERDGWLHLYSMPSSGGPAVLLTPGRFEVDGVSYSADGRTAVISSNQDDIDRRHLWRVTTSGPTPPAALTSGTGLE